MERINIANLHDGERLFEFAPSANELELGDFDCRDIKVQLKIKKTGSQLLVNGIVSGVFGLSCDRCTEPFERSFSSEFRIAYKYEFEGTAEEDEDDNMKFISPKTVFIDLTKEVRDYLLLSVPMRAVPDESEGICSVCNRDIQKMLNPEREQDVNPVWEKLINLKTKE